MQQVSRPSHSPAVSPGTPAPAPFAAQAAPDMAWATVDGRPVLRLAGDWRADDLPPLAPPPGPADGGLTVDCSALAAWDARLAADLWTLAEALLPGGGTLRLAAAPAGLPELLALARAGRAAAPAPDADAPPSTSHAPGAAPRWSQARITVAFVGEVLIASGRLLTGRARLRAADLVVELDRAGPRSVPIVLLTCGLVGLMLAYMGGAQLGRIGAQRYLADVVTVGMVRELAGLMTGVILAGRLGAGFAAQLAAMNTGEEIDALRALGVDPIVHLVMPRLIAMVLAAPALIGFGALAGIAAGWPAAVLAYGVTSPEYLHQSLRAMSFTHLWIGMFKGVLYAILVALAGCREGLHCGRSAADAGRATTTAVVKALVWIVAAACATTVVFTSLGY